MARKRASLREGPLAELFKATEAAQEQARKSEATPEAQAGGARRRDDEPEGATVHRLGCCPSKGPACIEHLRRRPRPTWPSSASSASAAPA